MCIFSFPTLKLSPPAFSSFTTIPENTQLHIRIHILLSLFVFCVFSPLTLLRYPVHFAAVSLDIIYFLVLILIPAGATLNFPTAAAVLSIISLPSQSVINEHCPLLRQSVGPQTA